MAHNLKRNEDGSMAYGGRLPAWHQLGGVNADVDTMAELAALAGMNWRYELVPLYYERETLDDDTHHIMLPTKRLVTINGERSLDHVVSHDYEYFQPAEHVEMLDRIIEDANKSGKVRWIPETALALGEGETTAYCIRLGNWGLNGDEVEEYLLMTDTVDGRHSLQLAVVNVRVVCQNTLNIGLRASKVKYALHHTPGHRVNTQLAIEYISKAQGQVREALQQLHSVAMSEAQVATYTGDVFETPKDAGPTIVRKMSKLIATADSNYRFMIEEQRLPSTAWTAFNAVTETVEHGNIMGRKGVRQSLVKSSGPAVALLTRAYEMALKG